MEFAHIFPGLLVGATGVGDGSIATPILASGFSVAPGIAVDTDLVFAALTKSAGTVDIARSDQGLAYHRVGLRRPPARRRKPSVEATIATCLYSETQSRIAHQHVAMHRQKVLIDTIRRISVDSFKE